ncbi:MAG: hypothetical protein DRO00_05070 [Thermoproteota archaeon]|nr:MAG: hypothetical protein DRO00_05070 [Candidatus Korarchaeota archaeon]
MEIRLRMKLQLTKTLEAIPTKRFRVYTAKWNRERLLDAILDFGEVELSEMNEPGFKRRKISRDCIDPRTRREVLAELRKIEKLFGSLPRVNFEENSKIPIYSNEELREILRETRKRAEFLLMLKDKKLAEKKLKELENLKAELLKLEDRIFSSLSSRSDLKGKSCEKSYTKIFRVLCKLDIHFRQLFELAFAAKRAKADPIRVQRILEKATKIAESVKRKLEDLDIEKTIFNQIELKLNEILDCLKKLQKLVQSEKEKESSLLGEELERLLVSIQELRELLADTGNSLLTKDVLYPLEEVVSKYVEEARPLLEKKRKLEEEISFFKKFKTNEEEARRLEREFWDLVKRLVASSMIPCRGELSQFIYESDNNIAVSGWVPETLVDSLERHLKSRLGEMVDFRVTEEEGPSYIELPSMIRPFSLLTHKMMGYPKGGQLDPTFLVSIFFPIMFGIMFGDIGQGLTLLVFGLILKRRGGRLKDIGQILVPMGVCSTIVGFLYGEMFLKEIYDPILFSPVHEPIKVMALAVLFGLIHLNVAFAANITNKVLGGEYLSILSYGGILTLMMYDFAALAAYKNGGDVIATFSDPLFMVASIIFFASTIAILLVAKLRGHGTMEGFMEVIEGVIEAVIGLLANTLSYLRLAGFAISHAAFGMMVSAIVGEESGISPSFIMVMFLMNMLAMGLEGIIAFIQATRLTLYEFLTKFFKPEGRLMRPVSVQFQVP